MAESRIHQESREADPRSISHEFGQTWIGLV